jgi:hypothetical protein
MFIKLNPQVAITQINDANGYTPGLQAWADGLAASGQTVFVSVAAEMNGDWNSNYGFQNGSAHAAAYKTFWNYVHDTINTELSADHALGAAQWVFNPNADCNVDCTTWGQYWPGSSKVDDLAFDEYVHSSSDTFSSMFGSALNEISGVNGASIKPLWVGETGIVNSLDQTSLIGPLVTDACNAGVTRFDYYNDSKGSNNYTLSTGAQTAMKTAWDNLGACGL